MVLGASIAVPTSVNCGRVTFDRDQPDPVLWLTQNGFGRELFTLDPIAGTVTPVSVAASVPLGYAVSSVVASGPAASLVLVADTDEATDRPVTAPDGTALPPLVLTVDSSGAVLALQPLDPDDPPTPTPPVPGATPGDRALWTVHPMKGAFEVRQHDVVSGDVVAMSEVTTTSFGTAHLVRALPVAVGADLYVLVNGVDDAGASVPTTELHRISPAT